MTSSYLVDRQGRKFAVRADKPVILGRETGVDLLVDDDSISRRHGRISAINGAFFITDLNSSNGTYVNGSRVGGSPTALKDGDFIRLGSVDFTFHSSESINVTSSYLVDRQGRKFAVRADKPVILGRETGVDLLVDDDSISRRHGRISAINGAFFITDLDSSNGTYVNGSRVGGPPTALKDGDFIRLGSVDFTFHSSESIERRVPCPTCGSPTRIGAGFCPKCGAPPPKLVYCTRCGGRMLDAATKCPACGAARHENTHAGSIEKSEDHLSVANQPTAVLPPRSATREAATSQPKWQCPKCDSEHIEKLSVIYSEGTTSTTQGVIGLGLSESGAVGLGGAVGGGTSSTIMAKGVAPPIAPNPPDTADNSQGIGCLAFVVVGFLALLFSGVSAMMLSDQYPNLSPGFLFLLVVTISLSLGSWAASSAARSYKKLQEDKRQAELSAYNEALSLYNEAAARWLRSYLCHRCGSIFELQS